MDKAHVKAILATAGATDGKDGWVDVPDGKSITLYVAHGGATMQVARTVALKLDGALVFARTAKGETYILAESDLFAGAIEGGTTSTVRKAGFGS